MTEEMFTEAADSGDILLFRSDNSGSWLQRKVVQSHFDHVGLVLRFGDDISDLYILEAVGELGVRMTSWVCARQFVGSFFEKVAFRKLFVEMTEERMQALDQFRRNSCGKEYALNLKKIFTAKSEAVSQGK